MFFGSLGHLVIVICSDFCCFCKWTEMGYVLFLYSARNCSSTQRNCISLLCVLGQGRSTWVMSLSFLRLYCGSFWDMDFRALSLSQNKGCDPIHRSRKGENLSLDLICYSLCPCSPYRYLRVALSNTLSVIKQYLTTTGEWKSKPLASKHDCVVPDSHVWPKSEDLLTYCISQNCSNMLDVILLLLLLVQMKMW